MEYIYISDFVQIRFSLSFFSNNCIKKILLDVLFSNIRYDIIVHIFGST